MLLILLQYCILPSITVAANSTNNDVLIQRTPYVRKNTIRVQMSKKTFVQKQHPPSVIFSKSKERKSRNFLSKECRKKVLRNTSTNCKSRFPKMLTSSWSLTMNRKSIHSSCGTALLEYVDGHPLHFAHHHLLEGFWGNIYTKNLSNLPFLPTEP